MGRGRAGIAEAEVTAWVGGLLRVGVVAALVLVAAPAPAQEIPDDPEALAARADTLYRTGRLAQARPLYERLAELRPEDGQAWYRLGTTRYQTGDFPGAAEGWTRALELNFQAGVSAYNAASAWGRVGNADSTLAYLRTAVERGFDNDGTIRGDSDLEIVRDHDEFPGIVEGVSRNAHPCRYDDRFRELDFALGRWATAAGPRGIRSLTQTVERVADGCAIRVTRATAQGDTTTALFHRDPSTDRWSTVGVDGAGDLIRMTGALRGDTLAMEGRRVTSDGQETHVRASLAPGPAHGELVHRVEVASETGDWTTALEATLSRESWELGAGGAPGGAPSLRYVAFHGGARAGAWQESNLAAHREAHPELVTAFRPYNIYAGPVPRALHDVIRESPPPDVLGATIAGVTVDWVREGRVADLTDLWREEGWDTLFPPALVGMSSVDGRRRFLPGAVQPNPIYYRPDVFQALRIEPPETWDELLEVCGALRESGKVPFTNSYAWPPPLARWFTMLNLRVNGPAFHRSLMRGGVSWTDDRVRAVFRRWIELFDGGCLTTESSRNNYVAAVAELMEGEAGMWLIGEWVHEGQPPEAAGRLDFFTFPVLNPELPRAEIVHVYGALIPEGAPNPDPARDFLRYLGSRESQASLLEGQDRLPARLDVPLEGAHARHRKARELLREIDEAVPLFEVSTHRDVAQAGMAAFQRFWREPTPETVDAVLADLEEARRKAYGPAGM